MKKTLIQFIALICIELMIFLPIYSVNALTISNVQVSDVTANSAKVTWTTDEFANGKIDYGISSSLGSIEDHSNFLKDHTLFLNSLNSETNYLFSVESENSVGDTAVDDNSGQFYSFATLDINPPSKVTGLESNDQTKNSISLNWDSSTAPDLKHYNIYRDNLKVAESSQNTHLDESLLESTFYSYKVSAVDLSGNEGLLSDSIIVKTLTPDLTAPALTSLQVFDITDTTATINWLTNEKSTSYVFYGENNFDKFHEDSTLVFDHTIILQQLVKNNEYNLFAGSCDKDNNCVNSTKITFTAGLDTTPPPINVTLPNFINKRFIDIISSTEPFSSVKLFVNNFNVPERFSNVGASGVYEFLNVVLQKENLIKIEAKDRSKNINEKTFRVSVDVDEPEVVLNDIPDITSDRNFSVIGTVNEPVTINIFLIPSEDLNTPEKIENLNAVVNTNSVRLDWDEVNSPGFSHYVIYRDDVGAIAITRPRDYNSFTDLLVNSDFSYTYQVSAVNLNGIEGPLSNPFTVTIPPGGQKGISQPKGIENTKLKKPNLSFNATGAFSKNIRLGSDGIYSLIIEFVDRASNIVIIDKKIIKDTKPPKLAIISPAKGTSIYENYANQVDIEGLTESFAEVHLFVDRAPLGFLDTNFDVSGLPNKLENLPESRLRVDCNLKLGNKELCSTGADFSTVADSEGKFFFDNVDLTSIIAAGLRVTEESLTDFGRRDRLSVSNLRDTRSARLLFIATEASGLRSALDVRYNLITCWSGNQTWDIIPLLKWQSPQLISTERLAEGNEHIQFVFNYTYLGRGSNGFIRQGGITLSKACQGTELLNDDRFNVSCRILPPGAAATSINPEGKVSVTSIRLNPLPNMDKFAKKDWGNFFKQLGTEVTFPFKVRITYSHTIDGREVTETQTTCQEVTFFVDNSRIDPRDVLPDFLLEDFVSFLDDSVNVITDVKDKVDTVLEYVVLGCVTSFLLRATVQVYRRWTTFFTEKKFAIENIFKDVNGVFKTKDGEQDYCTKVTENIKEAYGLKGFTGIKLKYYSDKDLRRCFPSVASAWKTEADLYKAYRFTCDRVFGHSTPSRWTESKEDDFLVQKYQTGSTCAVDESARGKPLRSESCRELAKKFRSAGVKPEDYGLNEKCFEVYDREERKATLYRLNDRVSRTNNIYNIGSVTAPSVRSIDYAVKVKGSDTSYLTAQPNTCAQICGVKNSNPKSKAPDRQAIISGEKTETPSVENVNAGWGCITTSLCNAINNNPQSVNNIEVKSSIPRGYSQDCFYQSRDEYKYAPIETNNPDSVSDDPNLRYECCCLNAVIQPDKAYYQPDDRNKYPKEFTDAEYAFESKTDKEKEPQPNGNDDERFSDMKWSYRYWKEKYVTIDAKGDDHYRYNKDRYIEGRDLPACFGQNNWFYENFKGGEENLLRIDPAKQHTSAFQCLNVAGISNRLTVLTNIETALSGCLKTVRETGTADAGVCKELFTRYVCSTIWDTIQFFSNSCSIATTGPDAEKIDEGIIDTIRGGASSIWGAVADSQLELQNEYGNAQLNNLLGAGEEAIARKICLAAFGYDWELSVQNIIDISYTQPFATLVSAITNTREYLSIDPRSSQPRYEYRASWFINPGCDFANYNVELSCVGRKQLGTPGVNCNKVNDPGGNNCDCKNQDEEQRHSFFNSRGALKQNVVEDTSWSQIIQSPYRYDHIKFTLRPDRRIKPNLRDSCFPDGHEDGVFYEPLRDKTPSALTNCQVDLTTGTYRCVGAQSLWDSKGIAYFIDQKINDQPIISRKNIVVKEGEPIVLQPTIYKAPDEKTQCFVAEIPTSGRPSKVFENINIDGPHPYSIPLVTSAQKPRGSRLASIFNKCEFTDEGVKNHRNSNCNQIYNRFLLKVNLLKFSANRPSITLKFIDDDDGNIDLSADSRDLIEINGNQRVISTYQGNVIINEDGAEFEIVEVPFHKDLKSIEFIVNIRSVTSTSDQTVFITYGLYHLKEESASCQDYNPAELIFYQGRPQKNRVAIRITSDASQVPTQQTQQQQAQQQTRQSLEDIRNKYVNNGVIKDIIPDDIGLGDMYDQRDLWIKIKNDKNEDIYYLLYLKNGNYYYYDNVIVYVYGGETVYTNQPQLQYIEITSPK